MTLTPRFPHFLHGGDYNPDQWLKYPDVLEEDIRLMREVKVNCVSLGIFAWARLEPEEGKYDFAWMDRVIDRLWAAGIRVDLATPSGARPAWLAEKYPEVLRVDEYFRRHHFGGRHNHCPSSPVFREKVTALDRALAERYASHPAVILWHISNEFSGDCRCPLCQEKWREFLKDRYGSLESLNDHWWTGFWSMRYTNWSQVESPSPIGQDANPAMWVDWRRFSTKQCRDFILMEREALKSVDPTIPVTVNMMQRFWDYDYFDLAETVDVISWDSYPAWGGDDLRAASEHAMTHDLMRSLKKQPFLLMESTPSLVNWHTVNKIKRPGMHLLSSMLPLAHGSQSVMYFQWRKGRGGSEMFHGAVIGHDGTDRTRTFGEVRKVGEALEALAPLYDENGPEAPVCILFDYPNWWAIDYAQMGRKGAMHYDDTVNAHYRALWQCGISVDFSDSGHFSADCGYRLVVAPMLFMLREDIAKKLRAYVAGGGTLVMTYCSGVIDEDGLAFTGSVPHGLTDVLGVAVEEMDTLYDGESNHLTWNGQHCAMTEICELIHTEGAEVLAVYEDDYVAGTPCITRNTFEKGQAYYLAGQCDETFLREFYRALEDRLSIPAAMNCELPDGVIARRRGRAVFVQNYSGKPAPLSLPSPCVDLLTGKTLSGEVTLPACGVMVLSDQSST